MAQAIEADGRPSYRTIHDVYHAERCCVCGVQPEDEYVVHPSGAVTCYDHRNKDKRIVNGSLDSFDARLLSDQGAGNAIATLLRDGSEPSNRMANTMMEACIDFDSIDPAIVEKYGIKRGLISTISARPII